MSHSLGELASTCRALKKASKIKAALPPGGLENLRSRGLEPPPERAVSEIRRLLWNALPGVGDFQRPSCFSRPDRPPFCTDGTSERARVRVPGDSYLPDGECSVKSIWGTRIRLAASPSRDKIPCRCITNGGDGGTAGNALARGYAPAWSVGLFLFRLGRPPPSRSLSSTFTMK